MAKKVIRNRSQITSTINPQTHNDLKNISDQTDIPISKLLDKSVELLKKDFINKGLYDMTKEKLFIDINLPDEN